MHPIQSFCFCWFVVAQFRVVPPVSAATVVFVPVVVLFVRDPVLFGPAVAVLVAVVFLDVVVNVLGVASVSGLFVDVSLAVVVLIPIGLRHIDAVISLSPCLFQSPSRLLLVIFVCCCC